MAWVACKHWHVCEVRLVTRQPPFSNSDPEKLQIASVMRSERLRPLAKPLSHSFLISWRRSLTFMIQISVFTTSSHTGSDMTPTVMLLAPRTSREYRCAPYLASPLAKYSVLMLHKLPSLELYKDTCRVLSLYKSRSKPFAATHLRICEASIFYPIKAHSS